ncbi:glycosyltransferase [Desulfovibrio mangrovi]|uniref:glycosyltransferase family 2 protein n=1 Tax=Desulfovibrio mangrovi TaxID=2976983 RepID=UPI0022458671|nr:glycosyltransferase family 2 protein [Desulfovibrio mangrovi]UZP67936.1 glycosyltransferase [Desulfovibrio mangrovi]
MIIDWKALAPELSRPLLKGGVGKVHLLGMADTALGLAGKGGPKAALYTELGCDMLLAAWEHDCLDADTAGHLLALHRVRPMLKPEVLAVVSAVHGAGRPDNLTYLNRLLQKRETDKTFRFLEQQREKTPAVLFWAAQALIVGFYEAEYDRVSAWLHADTAIPAPLKERLFGDVAFAAGDYAAAVTHYERAVHALPLVSHSMRLAEAVYRTGDTIRATGLWEAAAAQRPWCINILFRLHDVKTGLDVDVRLPEGLGAALLYTWNKAEYLDRALESIAASEMDGNRVVVLDNGSTDATPDVLKAWCDRMGRDRMEVVTLPLNVGAPAARNWLMHIKALADCRWVAYLDDDAMLPPDWLGRFGAAMHAYPDALAWGCKVVDHTNPMVLQSVDLHLDEGGEVLPAPEHMEPYQRRFSVSDIHHQELDFGWFDYVRPCASVTGCTHMYLRETLVEHGGFDLRFSPSQYDDLEHDLRGVLYGRLPVYTGHLRVTHMKRTGKAARTDSGEFGNAYANMYKLQMKYTAAEFETMRCNDEAAAQTDLLAKLLRLEL